MTVLSGGAPGVTGGSGWAGWAAGTVGGGGTVAGAGPVAAILRLGPEAGAADAPDYTPARWPEAVVVVARTPLDPLGTVLIPPNVRAVLTRGPGAEPAASPLPMAMQPVPVQPMPAPVQLPVQPVPVQLPVAGPLPVVGPPPVQASAPPPFGAAVPAVGGPAEPRTGSFRARTSRSGAPPPTS